MTTSERIQTAHQATTTALDLAEEALTEYGNIIATAAADRAANGEHSLTDQLQTCAGRLSEIRQAIYVLRRDLHNTSEEARFAA